MPMLSGAFTEWSPAFGESWQIVHVPLKESGTVTPLGNVTPLRPATPLIVIGFVSKICWPRAIDRRAAANGSDAGASAAQALKSVNAFLSKGAPVGLRPTGSLMPTKNGCAERAVGPPAAP